MCTILSMLKTKLGGWVCGLLCQLLPAISLLRHNDLPWQLREYFSNQLERVDLSFNSSGGKVEVYGDMWHTDIPRLQAGMVGAQVTTVKLHNQALSADSVASLRTCILGYT